MAHDAPYRVHHAPIVESVGRGDWRFTSPLLRRYVGGLGAFD
jgi:hypothetical protein